MPKKQLDGETAKLLKSIVDHFEAEDLATRERQLKHYRRLKLYWNNMSMIYWSEGAQDYRLANFASEKDDQAYYDRPLNIFRAFLETIIAALSIQIPTVVCAPEDAENSQDITTAKVGNKIAEKIYKDNNAMLLWLKTIYIYCTEGMVACYHYPKEDKKYGTYEEAVMKDEEIEAYACPECGSQLPDDIFEQEPELPLGEDGGEEEFGLGAKCPECGALLDPEMKKTKLMVPKLDKIEIRSKKQVCLEVYGGLYVKVANYAMEQADTPYLGFAYETHFANAVEKYESLRGEIKVGKGTGIRDPYETTARLNPQYKEEYPDNNVTVRNYWLRPCSFNVLDEEQANKLKKEFPDGAKVVLVNEICADYENEALDDRWTLTKNPTSDYLTVEPLGELLTNVQDIVNDLISLTLQLIEHGIVETWADPAVVDFGARSQMESNPGVYTATKSQGAGKNISDAFFASTAAVVNPEIFSFFRIIQELGQFVSAAMPSLFGGTQTGKSSGTASEYAMSKGMALQRLQTPWRMFTIWWMNIFLKAIPQYISELKQDEKFVERDKQGNFVNVLIRKAELGGKIGHIELDPSDQMPVTEDQKRDVIMELFQLNNAEIMMALTSPENLPMTRKIVKIPEFKLPGEDDRQKQYEEINTLITEEPEIEEMPTELLLNADPAMLPPAPMMSTIRIEPDVDLHPIHAEVCRSWLVSDAGRLAKVENAAGYQNVLLHMKEHLEIVRMQEAAQQAAMMAQEGQQNGEQGKKPSNSSEVKNEGDVNAPIK